jgi:DNA-binding FadR family transcriptional regulator
MTTAKAAPSPIRRTKLSDQIYDLIYQRITTGQYAPESRLPAEADLAAEFRASRPVIREALTALKEDGVIQSRERVGNFVTGSLDQRQLRFLPLGSLADVQRCFVFRISLEGEAAFFAAGNRSAEDVAAIREAAANVERLVAESRPSIDADYAFHLTVVTATHNPFFVTTLKSLINHVRTGMNMCRTLSLVQPELHVDQMKQEHRRVVDAIAAGDRDAAREALRAHLDASRQRVFAGQHLL